MVIGRLEIGRQPIMVFSTVHGVLTNKESNAIHMFGLFSTEVQPVITLCGGLPKHFQIKLAPPTLSNSACTLPKC